jgi:hypothetical protein
MIGEKPLATDAQGRLLSRIGTIFLRTPGLVTRLGAHAFQRALWLEELNAERARTGAAPLTAAEEQAELDASVDLIFTEGTVLIRPDPERMDLALQADKALQALVSKRHIRYLNTHALKVRSALCARGENWRMARQPVSQEDMVDLIARSRVAINERPIYYYNHATGTRFITASGYDDAVRLDAADFRRQVKEVVAGLRKRNRLGYPEVDIFPATTPIDIKRSLQELDVDGLGDAELRDALDRIDTAWRMSLPPELREETPDNYDWRNAMCHAITRRANETAAEEQELISGIAPEFYRQIEWLPGARIESGELIFDEIWAEAARTQEPELLALCDSRVKALIFNLTRLFGSIEFINIGRIAHSLARRPVVGNRRGHVYIVQYCDAGDTRAHVLMIRFQKWGVAERLDEGKDLLQAILESDEYSDYILDRRLMCRQLGMNLPQRVGYGHFTEKYTGRTQYNGVAVRAAYFARPYVCGIATDKVPAARYRNPAFALAFARLLGAAAAVDCVVGRRSSLTGEMLFDGDYEVLMCGADGLPESIRVTDHAGSFVNYTGELADSLDAYAEPVRRRRAFLSDSAAFARAYAGAFAAKIAEMQAAYRARRPAFDCLFADRPCQTDGSGAYRWSCVLARLDRADAEELKAKLLEAAVC